MKNEIKLPPSKHEYGYTKKEILDIIRPLKINHNTFWKKFGINTCALHPKTNERLMYACDIELAIRCCIEKRDKTIFEWD